MFLQKPSSLYRLLLVHLALAVALFNLMVVASPLGTTQLLKRDPETSEFVIKLGRKQTGSDAWLPNSVDFAKDQKLILLIGNHLLEFQASNDPHIIHQNQIPLPDRSHCILLGGGRHSHLSLTIRSDKAAVFWAQITNLSDLEAKVGWKIHDDLDYNYAVLSVLIHGWGDPEWERMRFNEVKEWSEIISVNRDLRNNIRVPTESLSAKPKQ
ncbi:hypothetical protein GGU10DRAFT_388642 [Lentinula aff. detonsa]|uniref:Uncharacterized protein n=1 Tax=Lentinula aff. detonsa TaxID=2804958 RepID=A0AA38KFF0_9AGAR|nr:hypothetical protein GGU10DRAFT_388642 [Lentinula aff. detonsa]